MGSEAKGGRNRAIWGRLLENQESQEARVAVKQSHGTGSGCLKILESVKSKSGNQSVVPLWKVETQLEVEVRKWGLEAETWEVGEVGCSNLNLGQIGKIPIWSQAEKNTQAGEIGNWKEILILLLHIKSVFQNQLPILMMLVVILIRGKT